MGKKGKTIVIIGAGLGGLVVCRVRLWLAVWSRIELNEVITMNG